MKGILGRKVGMTEVFSTDGKLIPVTVIEVEPNVVTQVKTVEKDGYDAIQLGAFDKKTAPILTELEYSVGDRVEHIKFGQGTVKEIKSGGRDFEVTVEFDSAGIKKMFASFAKLKLI